MRSQQTVDTKLVFDPRRAPQPRRPDGLRHSGRRRGSGGRQAGHSGIRARVAGFAVAAVFSAAPAPAQASTFEVALRTGQVLQASEIEGDLAQGLVLLVRGERRRIEAEDLLAVHGPAAQDVELPAAFLAGGDVVRGQIVGGDAVGDRVDLWSPVLGRVQLPVDRLAALAATGVRRPLLLRLPEGVTEALFLRAAVGHDVVAGSLHQFGEQGVRFQPEGGPAPRWYAPGEFVALRIADAAPRGAPAPMALLTRTGDRLGVVVRRVAAKTVQCELEGGAVVEVRLTDVACVSFLGQATFLSDLVPTEVVESGLQGEAVHPWQRDASALGGPLVSGGRAHARGLGVHSRSRLVFRVPAGAVHFWTRVGLDDSSAELGVSANADVRVLLDGTLRFERKGLGAGEAQDTGLIEVRPGQLLALEVDFGRARDIGDRVDWLSPVFLPAGGRRP